MPSSFGSSDKGSWSHVGLKGRSPDARQQPLARSISRCSLKSWCDGQSDAVTGANVSNGETPGAGIGSNPADHPFLIAAIQSLHLIAERSIDGPRPDSLEARLQSVALLLLGPEMLKLNMTRPFSHPRTLNLRRACSQHE